MDQGKTYQFEQIHIDIARNATDDFNPFHDPYRWWRIRDNPFGGPIVLGFQLAALADYLIDRRWADEAAHLAAPPAWLSYDFHFAAPLRPGEPFAADVRHTIRRPSEPRSASNRVILKRQDGQPILLGSRTARTQRHPSADPEREAAAERAGGQDRVHLDQQRLFLKRKYLTTSNGKNFVLGALADQHFYFDELAERVHFPPMFTAALLSCALLERAWAEGYDFEGAPQVYVSQRITVDNRQQRALCSNDRLDIVVGPVIEAAASKGLSRSRVAQQVRHCVATVPGRGVLFHAQVQLATLQAILEERFNNN